MLANPSFELPGSGGVHFAGWSQFGAVGSSASATHGAVAARASGPDRGGWDVSAFWQPLDTAPGERWAASVVVWHSSARPLTGQSRAIVNIEWRDAVGDLISYESHTAADASTVPDHPGVFSVQSQPAPAGTATTRFLLGVLQSPTESSPDVFYDQATFDNLGPPTLDELQWTDFPGGRTLEFAGRTWRVKGPGFYAPGPNLFCDTPACIWVDAAGRLHVTIQTVGGSWSSTEVALEEALGYGDYVFTTVGRLDTLDPHAVLGLFLWQYGPCYDPADGWWNPYDEIDVEFSRWGDATNGIGQFVAQPWDYPGNLNRFDAAFGDGELASHAFRWLPDRVEFRSWRGGPGEESPAAMIHEWTYAGPHIPRPEQPRVHVNLWQFESPPAAFQEVILDEFTFVPEGGAVHAREVVSIPSRTSRLFPARPTPFRLCTTLRYSTERGGEVEVTVHDVLGRLVRTLENGTVPSGDHEVVWNGRDERGARVASGVYFYRLRAHDAVETRRVVVQR